MRIPKPVVLVVGVLLGLTASGCGDRDWSNQTIAESKKRGDQIVAALEAYKGEAGEYPKNLAALVPRHIEAIPLPTAGERKWYYISGGINYMLSFSRTASGASPEWARTNETSKWELVDKEF